MQKHHPGQVGLGVFCTRYKHTDWQCAGVLQAILFELTQWGCSETNSDIGGFIRQCAAKEKWAWMNLHGMSSSTQFTVLSYRLKFATWHCQQKFTQSCIVKGNCCTTCNWHNQFPRMATLYCAILRGWMEGTKLNLYNTSNHKIQLVYIVLANFYS